MLLMASQNDSDSHLLEHTVHTIILHRAFCQRSLSVELAIPETLAVGVKTKD